MASAAAFEGATLVAVADRRPAAQEQARDRFAKNGTEVFKDGEALFSATPDLDLVCIATNSPSHIPLARLAIAHGVRKLLIEKPFGVQPAASSRFLNEVADKNVRIAVNFSRRWSSDYRAIRRYLESGEIGRPVGAYVAFGAGGLAGKAVHFVDLLRFLFGDEFVAVSASLDPLTPSSRGESFIDPSGCMALRFRRAGHAMIDVSANLVFRDGFIVIETTAGRIEIDERMSTWSVHAAAGRFTVQMIDRPGGTLRRLRRRALVDLLVGEPGSLEASGADGLAGLEAIIGAHRSAKLNGASISLPLASTDAELEVPFP